MQFNDWFLFISTFIIGLLGGAYLYLTVFVPEYVQNPDIIELSDQRKERLQVSAEQYGGCDMTSSCAAYAFSGDRQYRYQPGVIRNTQENIETGDIPRALFNYILETIEEADLTYLASPAQRSCTSWVDGIDVRYNVEIGGEFYLLDTCTTQLEASGDVAMALQELFIYMNYPDEYVLPEVLQSGGLGGVLEGVLEDSFGDN